MSSNLASKSDRLLSSVGYRIKHRLLRFVVSVSLSKYFYFKTPNFFFRPHKGSRYRSLRELLRIFPILCKIRINYI